jgi:hypothetical protein
MSATTFAGGPVELHTFGDIAPFNVLDPPPRQRSSSLSAALHADMPGLWSRTGAATKPRSRVSSASQNNSTTTTPAKPALLSTVSPALSIPADLRAEGSAASPTPVLGHRSSRQKITEKGKRERRLSVNHRSSNDSDGQSSATPVMDSDRQPVNIVARAETPSDGETNIINVQTERANAYAALTGSGSSPVSQMASSSTASSAQVTPIKTPRRTRVQSASAVASSSSTSASPSHSSNAPPPVTAARKKRRSLSQQNSLIATRIAKAFLLRELGEAALTRRCTTAVPKSSWSQDDTEQRELWFALHDGVLLCRWVDCHFKDNAARRLTTVFFL